METEVCILIQSPAATVS